MLSPGVTHEIINRSTHVVTVRGELDVYSSPEFVDVLRGAGEAERLIVDFTECRYIDSSVISALIRARKELKGEMRLVIGDGSNVRRVIAMTHVDTIIPVVSTAAEAIGSTP